MCCSDFHKIAKLFSHSANVIIVLEMSAGSWGLFLCLELYLLIFLFGWLFLFLFLM